MSCSGGRAANAAAAAPSAFWTFIRARPPNVAGSRWVQASCISRGPCLTTIISPRSDGFSTSALPPRRLNEVEVNGVNVIVDYCHNAPGMKMLGDFVDRVGETLESSHELARPSRIGVIATAGDRRDEDMRELGHIAAQHFDVVIVREDVSLRGRERGEVATLVAEGVRTAMGEGARCKQVEVSLDEIEAVRHAMARANKGDLLVICVDKHAAVMAELENWGPQAQPGAGGQADGPAADPDY